MCQKIFRPHENVAKYFGTPPLFTPPRYPELEMTDPYITTLTLVSPVVISREKIEINVEVVLLFSTLFLSVVLL